jgi:uncharacterized protein
MVHVLPLPGSPRWTGSMADVLDRARADAAALADGGVDAVLVENYGDSPFLSGPVPAETVAALTAAVVAVAEVAGRADLPVGVNVLRNDAAAALAIATATGASFIRVNVHTGGMLTDQGWIEGDAAGTLRLRQRLGSPVAILADVMVKHAVAPPGLDLTTAAREAWERGWADALIVSGAATGEPTDLEDVRRLRGLLPGARILVGSGVRAETVGAALREADGVIVGSALQVDGVAGRPVDPARVRRLVEAAHR